MQNYADANTSLKMVQRLVLYVETLFSVAFLQLLKESWFS